VDPTDGDWWWQYGLDGIVGGLLGGVVTAWAVLWTLRHERRAARHAAMTELVSELASRATLLAQDLASRKEGQPLPDGQGEVWASQMREIQSLAYQLWARAEKEWPLLSEMVDRPREELLQLREPSPGGDVWDRRDRMVEGLRDMSVACTVWLSDPKMKGLDDS
jgi:hypothetical protein